MKVGLKQGRRHEVLFGGDGFMGTQTHLPQINFLFGFRPLYFENFDLLKNIYL